MKCTVPGCSKRYYARGMCEMHWCRWDRAGRPGNPPRLIAKPGFARFQVRHPDKRNKDGTKGRAHRFIAEKALGRKLPPKAVVHHYYGNPDTLVICPSQTYHMLLEQRTKHLGLSI